MKKIGIRVQMNCDKCRREAMKIAAAAQGVSSVSLEGEENDQLVVTGDQVDPVCLMNLLRKKFCHAKLESVLELEVTAEHVGDDAEENMKEESVPEEFSFGHYDSHYYPPPCATCYYHVAYDSYPSNCSIL